MKVIPPKAIKNLTPLQARALERAVAVLREFYDPPAIFLFGSVAKGTSSGKSDIDLLVNMPSDCPRSRRAEAFYDVFRESYPRFDVSCFTDNEIAHQLANPNSFLSAVMKSARPLYLRNPSREPT